MDLNDMQLKFDYKCVFCKFIIDYIILSFIDHIGSSLHCNNMDNKI